MEDLIKQKHINQTFDQLFSFCTEKEASIVSSLNENFNNIDIHFCHLHVQKISHIKLNLIIKLN